MGQRQVTVLDEYFAHGDIGLLLFVELDGAI